MREEIRFFLPGPTYVLKEVRQAMTQDLLGHRAPAFAEIYHSLSPRLKQVFRTQREVLTATGSSTLIMQSALSSTVRRKSLHLTNGAFSERWLAMGQSLGLEAEELAFPWGQAVDPDVLRATLRRDQFEAVTVVHNETSTGVENPLAEIARVVHEESEALVLVDTVSSMAGAQVETDAWDLDIVLSGSQKALAMPPGLVFFTLSQRAERQADTIEHRGFYTDILRYRDKHAAGGTITTPAMSIVFAADRQLDVILEEGMENRWQRHRDLRDRTHQWAAVRGMNISAAEGARSMTVTSFQLRQPGTGPDVVSGLSARGYTVGSGYGKWKPDCFRIGHMSEVRMEDLDQLLMVVDAVIEGAVIEGPEIVGAEMEGAAMQDATSRARA